MSWSTSSISKRDHLILVICAMGKLDICLRYSHKGIDLGPFSVSLDGHIFALMLQIKLKYLMKLQEVKLKVESVIMFLIFGHSYITSEEKRSLYVMNPSFRQVRV